MTISLPHCWQDATRTQSSFAVTSERWTKERRYRTDLHWDEVHVEGETIWKRYHKLEHLNADPLLPLRRVCDVRQVGHVLVCERLHEQIDANRWR